MKIRIIEGEEVSRSPITMGVESEGYFSDLPEKLLGVVLGVLTVFKKCEVTEVSMDEKKNMYVVRMGQNRRMEPNTLSPLALFGTTNNAVIDTIGLLHWYLSPHMRARDPGILVGGANVCCECGHVQQTGRAYSKHCEAPECSSHAKWAEIYDGYEPPKRPESQIAKMVQKLCGKQVQTVPTTDNLPNSWAEKC